ncbi:MAG: hypothetical protein ACOCT0_05455, partial [Halobacteriota archaeon]
MDRKTTIVTVALALLVVGTVAAVGSAVADSRPNATIDSATDGSDTIFIGEDDGNIGDIVNDNGSSTAASDWEHSSHGELSINPVPWDQGEGRYYYDADDDNEDISVREPVPDNFELMDERGNELSDGQSIEQGETVTVEARMHPDFFPANLNVSAIVFEDDLDATNAQDITNVNVSDNRTFTYNITFDESGTYDIGVEPMDNDSSENGSYGFDHDSSGYEDFRELQTLEIEDEDESEIELDTDTVFQNERVDFEVSPGREDDVFGVFADAGDLRRPLNPNNAEVFRQVEDLTEVGHVVTYNDNGSVYYRTDGGTWYDDSGTELDVGPDGNSLTTDDGLINDDEDNGYTVEEVFGIAEYDDSAIGQIDAQHLDDADVDFDLYQDRSGNGDAWSVLDEHDGNDDVDDQTLTVDEAEIEQDMPPQTYVPGTQVAINGTTSPRMEDVSVFVRDRDNYRRFAEYSVDDGEYEETRVELDNDGESAANQIMSQPGNYRFGVIDTEDVRAAAEANGYNGTDAGVDEFLDDEDKEGGPGLDNSDFNTGAQDARSLRVANPSLDATFETYNGEVHIDDGLYVEGELIGPRDFAILATDARGNTMFEEATADRRNQEIDEDALSLEIAGSSEDLRSGEVRATALSPGRD